MRVAEMISMNIPIKSSSMLTDSRKTQGEDTLATTMEAIFPGICSNVIFSGKGFFELYVVKLGICGIMLVLLSGMVHKCRLWRLRG